MRRLVKMKLLLHFALNALLASIAISANAGEKVGDFALIDHLGTFHQMSWYDDNQAVVILSHAVGTKLSKDSLSMLTTLQARYDQRGIVFFGINPGLQTDRKLVAADAHESGLDLPMLMDDAQLVSESTIRLVLNCSTVGPFKRKWSRYSNKYSMAKN
jgi:hypothetical protein